MKKNGRSLLLLLFILVSSALMVTKMPVEAKGEATIKKGIYADAVDLAGMNKVEAEQAIESYVEELKSVELVLIAANNEEVITTAGDLGIIWSNPEIVNEAIETGQHGNVIQRYKVMKDLQHENKIYKIEFEFDFQTINNILIEECAKFDQEEIDFSLKRENDTFTVIDGQIGYYLDVETSIDSIYNYLTSEWNHEPSKIDLNIIVKEPKGSAQELAQVADMLGGFTTSFATSGTARSANVANACELVNGITIYPGEEFSTLETIAPFSQANGYYMAGSYLNGKVVDSLGGGICQVSTTLYNSVLKSELEVTERHNHSMIVSYVEPSADAAIAESAGKDFKFINNKDYPIYIEGTISNKRITFNIYGKETRDSNRNVEYISEVLEKNVPTSDTIYPDAGQPIGYIVPESAHIGYKARLWKVVTENGVEVSRTQVNSSSYKMVPRSAVVGTATADPNAYNEIMAAIGTANIDHIKNVIALLNAQAAQPPVEGAPVEGQ